MQTGKDLCSLFGVIEDETIDEVAMDDLFREILAVPPMPSSAAQTLVGDQLSANANTDVNLGKKMQIEMQRLFDLTGTTLGLTIDGIPPLSVEESGNTALELGPQRMGGIDRPHAAGILEQCPRPGFPTQPPVRNSHSLFFMCSLSLIGFLMRVCRLHPPYSVGQGPSHCQQRLPRDSDGQPQCRVMSAELLCQAKLVAAVTKVSTLSDVDRSTSKQGSSADSGSDEKKNTMRLSPRLAGSMLAGSKRRSMLAVPLSLYEVSFFDLILPFLHCQGALSFTGRASQRRLSLRGQS